MTMLRISDKTLTALDRFRSSRNIRTRAKALEVMLEELGVSADETLDPLLESVFAHPSEAQVFTEAQANTLALAEVKAHRTKRKHRARILKPRDSHSADNLAFIKQRFKITAAMHHPNNNGGVLPNSVKYNILTNYKTPQTNL